jgi:hypothetical protein
VEGDHVADHDVSEQPRAFDLLAVVGQLARAGQVVFSGRPSPIS